MLVCETTNKIEILVFLQNSENLTNVRRVNVKACKIKLSEFACQPIQEKEKKYGSSVAEKAFVYENNVRQR